MKDAAKITRRTLAVALVSAGGLAQTPVSIHPLQAAKDRIKANSDALAKEQVPMATEPAFQFKV